MSLHLRPERAEDRSRIATLIARAYGARGARVVEMAGALRELPQHQDSLSIVGVNDHKDVIAYALFTPVKVGKTDNVAVYWAAAGFDTTHEELDVAAFLQQVLQYVQRKGWHYVLCHGDLAQMQGLGFEDAEKLKISGNLRIQNAALLACFDGADTAVLAQGHIEFPESLTLLGR